jgi:hypothetical protein
MILPGIDSFKPKRTSALQERLKCSMTYIMPSIREDARPSFIYNYVPGKVGLEVDKS